MKNYLITDIEGHEIKITNPEKLFWPEAGITKLDYIKKLLELAPYMLPYTRNRLLTVIRYPHGVEGKSFYQKNCPQYAPEWVTTSQWHDNNYIMLNNPAILAWLATQGAIEFHTAFNYFDKENFPASLVFDLDPSEGQTFDDVAEAALIIHDTLADLNLKSWIKTSGATGLQIYIPIGEKYNYDEARAINEFFGRYFSEKYPQIFTIERIVKKRGPKLYFDYLQMWGGKTIISPYSPRATKDASVSAPLEWEELKKGLKPVDINLHNISQRLKNKGDLFRPLLEPNSAQNLDYILENIFQPPNIKSNLRILL